MLLSTCTYLKACSFKFFPPIQKMIKTTSQFKSDAPQCIIPRTQVLSDALKTHKELKMSLIYVCYIRNISDNLVFSAIITLKKITQYLNIPLSSTYLNI